MAATYKGRFSPSPTGPLHAGSLVAALASWLDARAHNGHWLVRIEDVDTPRTLPGADHLILHQLQQCGLLPDAPPVWQSTRTARYQQALDGLIARGLAYPCGCSRKAIEAALNARGVNRSRHGELVYPGTCRHRPPPTGSKGSEGNPGLAWRFLTEEFTKNTPETHVSIAQTAIENRAPGTTFWHDRRRGGQHQDVATEVGDFVLKRADGCFTYQLAVVVDDAAQGITHVVRGDDLLDNTARQIVLQQALGLPTPQYLHTPLVLGVNREKLSKQNGAQALDLADPLAALNQAAACLDLPAQRGSVADALAAWTSVARQGLVGSDQSAG